ncbi:MAG TPA: hypothetical protein VII06_22270 [Chloroflexota bacterium]|jgi:hypothetical protein
MLDTMARDYLYAAGQAREQAALAALPHDLRGSFLTWIGPPG